MRQIGNIVAFLIVQDTFQGGESIENGLGQDTNDEYTHLVNGEGRSLFMKQKSQANQEKVGESNKGHVMMPSQPRAGLIMVETDLAFAFFDEGFDGPTQTAEAHKLSQRCGDGGITEVELDHRRVIQVAANAQPEFATSNTVAGFNDAQERTIT